MRIQGFRGNCDPKASWGCAPALPNRTQVVSLKRAAGNQKFFDPTIFQKCWRGVGEQPTFAEQITELYNERKQKSKSKSKESQLSSNQKGCNEIQSFRGNCDSQASWGCAPALPNRTQVVSLKRAAGNQKFFDPTIFQKCWRGVGEQPTFAEQIGLSNKTATKI